MSKIAIYCRVSTEEQTTENQKLTLIKYANEKGFSYDIFEEVESSGKTRPVKQNLLEKLRAKEYDMLLIYKLDRWARSSTELLLEFEELYKKGIKINSYTDQIDFSTATGKLHFQILSAFAEFERSLIRERTKEGIKRAKAQGKLLGRPRGKKDGKKRRMSGYIIREAKKLQKKDQNIGINQPIENYIDKHLKNTPLNN